MVQAERRDSRGRHSDTAEVRPQRPRSPSLPPETPEKPGAFPTVASYMPLTPTPGLSLETEGQAHQGYTRVPGSPSQEDQPTCPCRVARLPKALVEVGGTGRPVSGRWGAVESWGVGCACLLTPVMPLIPVPVRALTRMPVTAAWSGQWTRVLERMQASLRHHRCTVRHSAQGCVAFGCVCG